MPILELPLGCVAHGLAFGTIAGPLTLLPGTYNVKVSIANSLAPCSESPLIDSSVSIGAKRDYSAVIALSQSGTPTLLTFANNLTPVAAGMNRLLFAPAADAPPVQLILQNTATMKLYIYAVKPGVLVDVTLPAGTYTAEINQGTTTLVPSISINLFSQSATLLFAVGQASSNSLILETRSLRDVI